MKRVSIYVALILLIVAIGGMVYEHQKNKDLKSELKKEETSYPEIYDVLDSITQETFERKVLSKDDFVVYIGRPTCPDCSGFEPQFINLIEELGVNEKIYYLNVAKISENKEEWNCFKELYGFQYVPTIAKIEQGKIVNKVGWTPENGIDVNEIRKYLQNLD